jgi:hypothetical protein
MSDGSRVGLQIGKETTYGTAPTGSGAYNVIGYTTESLKQNTRTVQSATVRDDRQRNQLRRVGINAGGDINHELTGTGGTPAADAIAEMYRGLMMQSAYSTQVQTTGTFTADNAAGTITGTGVGTGILVGQWIRFENAATVVSYHRVTAASSGSLTVVPKPADLTGTGDEKVTMGRQVLVGGGTGVTLQSFTVEREYADLASEWVRYVGMVIDRYSLQTNADTIVTGTFGFLGSNETSQTGSSGSSPNAANGLPSLSAVDNVSAIVEGGVELDVTSIRAEVNNGARERLILGSLGADSIGLSAFSSSGSYEAFYTSKSIADKYLNFTTSNLAYVFNDDGGRGLVFDWPTIRYSDAERVGGGTEEDVIMRMSWTAERNSTYDTSMRIVIFGVPS